MLLLPMNVELQSHLIRQTERGSVIRSSFAKQVGLNLTTASLKIDTAADHRSALQHNFLNDHHNPFV